MTISEYDPLHGQSFDRAERPLVSSPDAAFRLLREEVLEHGTDREAAWVITLDTRHRLLAVRLLSIGSIDHTFMSPRDILRIALLDNAAAIILLHTHPSGDEGPSIDDVKVTRRVKEACTLMEIGFLDHVVIGSMHGLLSWSSMARREVL